MRRTLPCIVVLCFATAAIGFAQNSATSQGTNTNQNGPQMQMNPPQPSNTTTGNANTANSGAAASSGVAADATKPGDTKNDKNTGGNYVDNSAIEGAENGVAPKGETEEMRGTKRPHTEIYTTPSTGPKSADPLLEPAPLPKNNSTLVGGFVRGVDSIRNRVDVQPFGSNRKIRYTFDERSHIFRDGRETTVLGIHKGDRVYVDSMLIGPQLFARNVRIVTSMQAAEAEGQIVSFDPGSQTVHMIDKLTGHPVDFRLSQSTEVKSKIGTPDRSLIKPGSLVAVSFKPGRHGGDAEQLTILAVPGSEYIFSGRVTNLDMHTGILAVDNQSDGKNYELRFNPATTENANTLRIGSQIAATATFNGTGYSASKLTIMPSTTESADK